MTCPACQRANTKPNTGMIQAGCPGCTARDLARGPLYFESAQAGAITPTYRKALERAYGENWKEGHAQVKDWAERLRKGGTS